MIDQIKGPIRWMHATGNRFAIIDHSQLGAVDEIELGRTVGRWVDGLLVLHPGDDSCDVVMKVINSDGSPARMCGNGLRCVAVDASLRGIVRHRTMTIRVGDHDARTRVRDIATDSPIVHVRMPIPRIVSGSDHVRVHLGNDHAVFLRESLPDENRWADEVRALHRSGLREYNLHVVHVVNRDHVQMRSWERGAGPTSACASGATAVVSALANLQSVSSMVTVTQPGGELLVRWRGPRRQPVNMGHVGMLADPTKEGASSGRE